MSQPVKLAVVGAGSIAIRAPLAHLSLGDLKDQVVLSAVCDPAPGRAKAAAEKFGIAQHFEDFEDMLAQGDFDAATICSPIGLHYEQGMKLIKAGKHIHFNKTMTTTLDEADQLIAAAQEKGLRLVASPGQMLRPQYQAIRKMLMNGDFGMFSWATVGAGFGDYHQHEGVRQGDDPLSNINPSWYFRKPGGGPLYDMTVYGLHTLTGIMGPAQRVAAFSGVLISEREFKGEKVQCDADDNTVMLLDFGQNRYAYVYGTAFGMLPHPWGMPLIYTSKGSIHGVDFNGKPIDYPGRDKDDGSGIPLLPHVTGQHLKMEEMHVYEDVMQLVDWVREGKPSLATAEHARHVIEIFEAAYRAAETGQTQALKSRFEALEV